MNFIHIIILSIIEGVTEFLPISSTGHLILVNKILGIEQTDFIKSFDIIIQLGAILAIVFLYWKKIMSEKNLLKPIMISFLPTAMIGFVLYKRIKYFLLGNDLVVILSLFLGGIFILFFEKIFDKHNSNNRLIEQLSVKKLVVIGLFQTLSVIPGVSRSLASIYGGVCMGLSKKDAVLFSFLLAIPTMFAATGLDLIKSGFSFSQTEWGMLALGFVCSFITAGVVVKWFLKYIENHSFLIFGIYRISVAMICILMRG